MSFYKDKNVLVTGGTGMIGRQLVELLIQKGAKVRIASLDDPSLAPSGTEFMRVDLTNLDNCINACNNVEFVFHLAGIKGSPKMMKEKPASYFVSSLLFTTNMMEAARRSNVKRFLFTSSVGVYGPSEIFYEDDTEKTLPSPNDLFGGWHKRTGELQAKAYQIQYGWNEISIVRPANVYGPYDNFDPENAMVIPSLIKRAMDGEDPLVVWGDGTPIRDFIHAKDVARGMMLVLEKGYNLPVNLGSGKGYTIKEIVDIIVNNLEKKPKIVWDTSKPSGDKKRLMDISRAKSLGWEPIISLEAGIKDTMEWYKNNKNIVNKRFNVFIDKS
ncbi:MAG: NAD(P)-dependent oxidoreductase [Nanoarchaeota archaeon]